jgi:uncharacterized damage-inducible protein DinB
MMDAMLQLQYRHSTWAMDNLFDAAEKLTAEQRAIAGLAGRGSIHDTLLHMLEVQQGWFAWFGGALPINEALLVTIDPNSVADFADLRAKWCEINARTLAFVNSVTDEQLCQEVLVQTPWTPDKVLPLWTMMLHVLSDGAQHRSEVATMLTEHGSSPGPLDLAFYILVPGNDAGLGYSHEGEINGTT